VAGTGIDLKLRLTLREGSIYCFEERHLTSPEPHYFIVANSDPLAQQVLLLSVVTSQVETVKLRRKNCLETLVELTPDDFGVLKKPSIVDCARSCAAGKTLDDTLAFHPAPSHAMIHFRLRVAGRLI
jgi:hypothetical protein